MAEKGTSLEAAPRGRESESDRKGARLCERGLGTEALPVCSHRPSPSPAVSFSFMTAPLTTFPAGTPSGLAISPWDRPGCPFPLSLLFQGV